MGDVEGFETADAGASETIPMEAGQIRKGGYICIKNRPCKVVSVSTARELVKSIREGLDAGDSLSVVVVKAMGEEHVMSCKKDTSA
ncbi:eukaryotic translation initiation factor [Aureococcus anophagefferens]|nr:eukaryotic translation initiation factor [Aureococcus anophagefferens]